METLGCINDMLQRDKENRELRKRNRERLTDTYHRLLDTGKETDLSQMTVEKMEDIRRKTLEKPKPSNQRLPKYVSSNFFAAENEVAFPCNTSCS